MDRKRKFRHHALSSMCSIFAAALFLLERRAQSIFVKTLGAHRLRPHRTTLDTTLPLETFRRGSIAPLGAMSIEQGLKLHPLCVVAVKLRTQALGSPSSLAANSIAPSSLAPLVFSAATCMTDLFTRFDPSRELLALGRTEDRVHPLCMCDLSLDSVRATGVASLNKTLDIPTRKLLSTKSGRQKSARLLHLLASASGGHSPLRAQREELLTLRVAAIDRGA